MTMETLDRVRSRITSIEAMPTIPVILRPLLRCLDQPVEEIDVLAGLGPTGKRLPRGRD